VDECKPLLVGLLLGVWRLLEDFRSPMLWAGAYTRPLFSST